jgi:hypothetical protein
LNGDGKDDVLLRNKNGRWYYYPMNGRRYITDARGYADLTRDLDWQVAGMGDLNGDHRGLERRRQGRRAAAPHGRSLGLLPDGRA